MRDGTLVSGGIYDIYEDLDEYEQRAQLNMW